MYSVQNTSKPYKEGIHENTNYNDTMYSVQSTSKPHVEGIQENTNYNDTMNSVQNTSKPYKEGIHETRTTMIQSTLYRARQSLIKKAFMKHELQ